MVCNGDRNEIRKASMLTENLATFLRRHCMQASRTKTNPSGRATVAITDTDSASEASCTVISICCLTSRHFSKMNLTLGLFK
jgi:hypothetical protein